MNQQLWLDPIPESLRAKAVEALECRDYIGFLFKADNLASLALVYYNASAIQKLGIYEAALLHAFVGTRTNNHRWPLRDLKAMFDRADRERLRAAGSPLPSPGPFTLYRGVAGRGPGRRYDHSRGLHLSIALPGSRDGSRIWTTLPSIASRLPKRQSSRTSTIEKSRSSSSLFGDCRSGQGQPFCAIDRPIFDPASKHLVCP
jgi:hypothetical protein